MNIKVTGTIQIAADHKTVFNFIANLENDKLWRKEINATTMTTKPQINALATEYSYLSKRTPNNKLELICTAFSENKEIVFQTLPDSPFFLRSNRKVEPLSHNETKVTYTIAFDKSIIKHALGFSLPTCIVYLVAKNDMKKYLTKLKTIMELNKL